jgi:outer membrane protein assembly factor BamA
VLAPLILIAALLARAQPLEHIVDIKVQGNVLTSDTDVIRIAGIEPGMPVDARTVDDVAARLRASRKFEQVDVLKRYASIADPSQISLVIVVDEGPLTLHDDGTVTEGADGPPGIPGFRKRSGADLMFMPLLKFEDGYGFSYGVRATMPDVAGKASRVSFPATWGAEKRVAVEFDRPMKVALSRLQAGGGIARRKNPFFGENDDRTGAWLRGDREIARPLRVGASGEWQNVSFGEVPDQYFRVGGDVTLDTRIDPIFARNAIYARAAWDHLTFENSPHANRTDVDLRGYLGLLGQSVLMIRGHWQGSNQPLPPYLRPLLGGTDNLRGFRAGFAAGDTLVGATAELRLPVTTPLDLARMGFSAFLDTATVYNTGQQVWDRHFQRGAGGGVWLSAAFLRFDLYIAHALGGSTRAQFATAISF